MKVEMCLRVIFKYHIKSRQSKGHFVFFTYVLGIREVHFHFNLQFQKLKLTHRQCVLIHCEK